MNKENYSNKAFTLAEVLITLGIIGIVAALTIPTLVNNYQKHQTAVALKKLYSVVSQIYSSAQADVGESSGWKPPTADWNSAASKVWWDEYFVPYMAVTKACVTNNPSECWASSSKFLDGGSTAYGNSWYTFVLKDGSSVMLYAVSSSQAQFFVDVNGAKEPNIVGKDIFFLIMWYPSETIRFAGVGAGRTWLLADNSSCCNKAPGVSKGSYCGAVIQADGWQIKDDYPWN